MRRLRVAVIGLGRLGKACAEALLDADTLNLAGIVRRRASIGRSRAVGLSAGADTPSPVGPHSLPRLKRWHPLNAACRLLTRPTASCALARSQSGQ